MAFRGVKRLEKHRQSQNPWEAYLRLLSLKVGVKGTMNDCCTDKSCALERLRERQTDTLRLVLLANAAMFVVELISGLLAGSVALLADSLDMLGDTLVYGFSLYVDGQEIHSRSCHVLPFKSRISRLGRRCYPSASGRRR